MAKDVPVYLGDVVEQAREIEGKIGWARILRDRSHERRLFPCRGSTSCFQILVISDIKEFLGLPCILFVANQRRAESRGARRGYA